MKILIKVLITFGLFIGVISCGGDDLTSGGDTIELCKDVVCENNTICNPDTGECVNNCEGVTCEDYSVCDKLTGNCVSECMENICDELKTEDFEINSQINTPEEFIYAYDLPVDEFKNGYTLKNNVLKPLSEIMDNLGLKLSDLDDYFTYKAYSIMLSKPKGENYTVKKIKKMLFINEIFKRSKLSVKFLVSRVISNMDEILIFKSLNKEELKSLLFTSGDFKNDLKELIKISKKNIFKDIKYDETKYRTIDDLIVYIQNAAISALKHRWEKHIKYGDLTKEYETLGNLLHLDLNKIEETIVNDDYSYYESSIAYNWDNSPDAEVSDSFRLPKVLLKEMSYRVNQYFFNKFRVGDILSCENDHGTTTWDDPKHWEWVRGYYNHTTLTIKVPFVNLDKRKIDPKQLLFFSAAQGKPDGADYEQRSKYQFVAVEHRIASENSSNPDKEWYPNNPDYWQLVRSRVFRLPEVIDGMAYSQCKEYNKYWGWLFGKKDCPPKPQKRAVSSSDIDTVVSYAESLRGKPYNFLTDDIYCSGITYNAYKQVGIDLESDGLIEGIADSVTLVTPDEIVDDKNTEEMDVMDYRAQYSLLLNQDCPNVILNDFYYFIVDVTSKNIAENWDERLYYQCPELREKANEYYNRLTECSIGSETDLERVISDHKLCKRNNSTSLVCLLNTFVLASYTDECFWLTQKYLTAYSIIPELKNNQNDYDYDYGKKFRKECVEDFDSKTECIYGYLQQDEVKLDFWDENFDYLDMEREPDAYDFWGDKQYRDKCEECFRQGVNLKKQYPDFMNFY